MSASKQFAPGDLPGEYPGFSCLELAPRKNKYALCVPVINEGERIRNQIQLMSQYSGVVDIVIADGGSVDGSLAPEFLAEFKVNTLLTKQGPGKLSAQMRMAIAYGLARSYSGLIFVDGNGKDDVSAVHDFAAKLDEGYDHVQGSRYLPGGHHENTPLIRHLAVNLLHAPLISFAAGYRYTDTTNGFRGYSAKLLRDPRVAPLRDVFSGYELHYYLAIRSARLGFRLTEIPVTRVYPPGQVPSKIKSWRGYREVLNTLFSAARHKYDPLS